MSGSFGLRRPDLSKIDQAWKRLVKTGEIDSSVVRPIIADSWKRCKEIGLDPYDTKCFKRTSATELKSRLDANKELIDIAWPLAEMLYRVTEGSGFRVDLTDGDGYLLKTIGDKEIIDEAEILGLLPGANRHETRVGTCGIGLALAVRQAVQVVGGEHFNFHIHRWTCSSAPIRDVNGKVIGVLNMTAHRNLVHKHTLGMLVAVAEALEKQFALKKSTRDLKLANEFLETVIGSINDGLIVINKDSNVTHFNPTAEKIFCCKAEEVVGRKAEAIFSMFLEIQQSLCILGGQEIQDREVVVRGKGGSTRCLMSVRFIREISGEVSGMTIILNKMERVRKLVHRMVGAQARFRFGDIIGEDHKFLEAVTLAKSAAATSLKVLLQGESGTGKEIFAQAIHNASSRRDGPFVAVNCAAIPRDLIESELFGYEDGAFTGARKGGKPGRFELAENGTLLLDEVGSMPMDMQSKLLRVLEDGQIVRVGGSEIIPVDVRIISATNRDLGNEVTNGNFRADLFYRLNSVVINIPPLRERRADISLFAEYFLKKAVAALFKQIQVIEPKAMDTLCSYPYPGNIRELENIIEKAVLVSETDRLTLECLPAKVLPNKSLTGLLGERGYRSFPERGTFERAGEPTYHLSDLEKGAISEALKSMKGNVSRAAKMLGIGRTTLYRKIKAYGILNVV
jgi:PAS domain S-box-containing protein